MTSDQSDVAARLSAAVGRAVRLARLATNVDASQGTMSEGYWPDHEWLAQRDEVFDFELPPGTFFDGAAVHLLTTATLDHLRWIRPAARFEIPRFRPNLVIQPADGLDGFVEDQWIGKDIAIGDVRLSIDRPCPRCVMTTLEQASLPKDAGVLQAAVRENSGNIGVYATVIQGGQLRRGDTVQVLEQ